MEGHTCDCQRYSQNDPNDHKHESNPDKMMIRFHGQKQHWDFVSQLLIARRNWSFISTGQPVVPIWLALLVVLPLVAPEV